MRTSHRVCLTAGLGLAALLGPAGEAAAGAYYVRACQAPGANFSQRLFTPFAIRSMAVDVDCQPEGGSGNKGWKVGSLTRRRGSRVPFGAKARVGLAAPKGSHFLLYRWSGDAARADCGFSLQSYARGPRGRIELSARGKPNFKPTTGRCRDAGGRRPRARTAALPRSTRHVLGDARGGATELYHSVACAVRRGCAAGGTAIEVYSATVQVVDYTRPVVQRLGGVMAAGGWVSGIQPLSYTAVDNVGIRTVSALKGVRRGSRVDLACDYTRLVPCPNGANTMSVDTRELPEGTHPLAVEAVDSAGNSGRSLGVAARVDNTPPPRASVAVLGGQGWRRTPNFTVEWANPSEGDRAPVAAAHYRVCAVGAKQCGRGRVRQLGITRLNLAPAVGEHSVTVWREDAAGNHEQDNESVPVTLRYDPEVPRAAFDPQSRADPTRVSVSVTDRVSGLAGGAIEISRVGSRVWQTLPTAKEGSRLVAQVDDFRLPPGQYALRARALDQAGNETSTDRRADGYPVVMSLPVRVATTMRAGVVRRKRRRAGSRRRVTVLQPVRRVRFGRRVRVAGRLVSRGGNGLPGARVQVYSRTSTSPERLVGLVSTDRRGRYRFTTRAVATSTLRFVYAGTRLILPAQREVTLKVPAATTIRVSRRRVRNGGSVVFRGRLRSPMVGKLVELQVRLSGRYQTFLTTRTGMNGRWVAGYRFRRSCGVTRYRFRARIPKEQGYPFEMGRSRSRVVKVRGPRCL